MNQVYEPLKDPAADGYTFVGVAVDPAIEKSLAPSKEDWKEPLLAKFKAWCAGFGLAVCVLVLGVAVGYGILAIGKDYLAHQAKVSAIQNPPSGSPEIGASPKNIGLGYGKSHIPNKTSNKATENIAAQAINTPAIPSFEAKKEPDPFAPALSEFDQFVRNFESKL